MPDAEYLEDFKGEVNDSHVANQPSISIDYATGLKNAVSRRFIDRIRHHNNQVLTLNTKRFTTGPERIDR